MPSTAQSVERIDETFRALFRGELPERLAALEAQLQAVTAGGDDEAFNAFYRGIHNIKGNAATFGFHALVSVCHRLEDLLKYTAPAARSGDPAFSTACLALLDLMPEAVADGEEVLEHIQARLAAVATPCEQRPRRALLIGDSRATIALCRRLLEERGFDTVEAADGYLALHRALTEPFSIIITTGQAKLLKGEALVAALRLSECRNRGTTAVVLSSGDRPPRSHKRNTDPDRILPRDTRLLQELTEILDGIGR